MAKIVLWISAVVFMTYGLVCLIGPDLPAAYAGLIMSNGDAYAEIGAMYGGLQTGVGLFCLVAALSEQHRKSGLLMLSLVIGALGLGRLLSMVVAAEAVTGYSWGALAYELTTAALATIALRRA
jgi:hypothetical protein